MATSNAVDIQGDRLFILATQVNSAHNRSRNCNGEVSSSLGYLLVIAHGGLIVFFSASSLILPLIYCGILPSIDWYDPIVGYGTSVIIVLLALFSVGVTSLCFWTSTHHKEVWSKKGGVCAQGLEANVIQACADTAAYCQSWSDHCFNNTYDAWLSIVDVVRGNRRAILKAVSQKCPKLEICGYRVRVPILHRDEIMTLNALWFFFFAGFYGVVLVVAVVFFWAILES